MNRLNTFITHNSYLFINIGIFFIIIILVNPLKDAPADDDFAYAWMVKNLFETGQYILHEWSVASILFQTYFGLVFVKLFGFSFYILRISTLFLVFCGIIFFYFLCKEFKFNNRQSGGLTLILFTSPLFMLFSFSFMSDVQFLCLVIIAVFFYVKSFNNNNLYTVILAGIACSAAILTRQVGIIFIPCLLFLWYFIDGKKIGSVHYSIGLLLPALAYIFQAYINLNNLNLITQFRMEQNLDYFSDLEYLLISSIWRTNTVIMYLVLYTLPLALLVIYRNVIIIKAHISNNKWVSNRLIIIFLYFLVSSIYFGMDKKFKFLLPSIGWKFDYLREINIYIKLLITLLCVVGAVFYTNILSRYFSISFWRHVSYGEKFLFLLVFFLLLFHLIYVQFADRYLIGFIPFILIPLGLTVRQDLNNDKIVYLLSVLIMIIPLLHTKEVIAKSGVYWKSGNYLLSKGVDKNDISSEYWTWDANFSWSDYIYEVTDMWHENKFHVENNWWGKVRDERKECARYLITEQDVNGAKNWRIIDRSYYRNILLKQIPVYIIQKEKKCNESSK